MKAKDFNRIFLSYLYDVLDMYKKETLGFRYYVECENQNQKECIFYDIQKITEENEFLTFYCDENRIYIDFVQYKELKATYTFIFKD